MQQAQEAVAKPAQRDGAFLLVNKRRVVELEFGEVVFQVLVIS